MLEVTPIYCHFKNVTKTSSKPLLKKIKLANKIWSGLSELKKAQYYTACSNHQEQYIKLLETPWPIKRFWEPEIEIKPIPEPSIEEQKIMKEVVNEKKLSKLI